MREYLLGPSGHCFSARIHPPPVNPSQASQRNMFYKEKDGISDAYWSIQTPPGYFAIEGTTILLTSSHFPKAFLVQAPAEG